MNKNLVKQAKVKQAKRLAARKVAKPDFMKIKGKSFLILPKVYSTGPDTFLQIENIKPRKTDNILDIGCGAGVASIILAQKAKKLTGTDINSKAVENAKANAKRHDINNAKFVKANCFPATKQRFNIIVCNPPYSDNPTKEVFEKMFWDKGNEMKIKVLKNAKKYLAKKGILYFLSADFADKPNEWFVALAEKHGLKFQELFTKKSKDGQKFYMLKFTYE